MDIFIVKFSACCEVTEEYEMHCSTLSPPHFSGTDNALLTKYFVSVLGFTILLIFSQF
jgi:hypothetical protein